MYSLWGRGVCKGPCCAQFSFIKLGSISTWYLFFTGRDQSSYFTGACLTFFLQTRAGPNVFFLSEPRMAFTLSSETVWHFIYLFIFVKLNSDVVHLFNDTSKSLISFNKLRRNTLISTFLLLLHIPRILIIA